MLEGFSGLGKLWDYQIELKDVAEEGASVLLYLIPKWSCNSLPLVEQLNHQLSCAILYLKWKTTVLHLGQGTHTAD